MSIKDKDNFVDNSPLGAILFIFHKNQHKYVNNSLKKYDLTINQALFLLKMYYSEEYLCQEDLVDAFYLTKGAVAKSIKNLEEKEFIIREHLEEDKRKYSLLLSSKGEEMIPIIQRINENWENKIGLNKLDKEFMEIFKDLTSKAIELNRIR